MASEDTGHGESDDKIAEYDREHGTPTLKDTERPSGLTEAGNKDHGAPEGEPWRNLKSH